MLDPKVAEEARQAWREFMNRVEKMQRRMLTAMAEKIDKQWADMAAPVAVPAKQPPKPSGVAAAAATAVDVARSVAETPDQRHDAATCCGERHEPDVGEGWRELGPDEILQQGDEAYVGHDQPQWVPTFCVGQRVADVGNGYRRRVTPSKPVEIDGDRPDVGEGWRWLDGECLHPGDMVLIHTSHGDPRKECYFMEIDAELFGSTSGPPGNFRRRVTPDSAWEQLRRKVDDVSSQANALLADALQKAASEVERLKAENAMLRGGVELLSAEATTLRSEVERLRLTPDEILSVKCAEAMLSDLPDGKHHADVLWTLLARLRGGE